MKKVLLIGGDGKIGRVLCGLLSSSYRVSVADLAESPGDIDGAHYNVDASDYDALSSTVSDDYDVVVNLAGMEDMPDIVDAPTFSEMVEVYLDCTYNALLLAGERGAERVVLASSNHVTDHYERGGRSLLAGEINESDYPLSDGVYGALKLCAETLGHAYHVNTGIPVVCLRIGTLVEDERRALERNPRFRRTLLSHRDAAELFRCSIEADVCFGVYYGVSDNPGKPWSLDRARSELGFVPRRNSMDVLGE